MTAKFLKPGLIVLCTALIFMVLLTVRPAVTYACSCVMPAAPLESLEKSAAVFSGEVVSIKKKGGIIKSSGDPVQVTFQVGEIWKGADDDTVTVSTAQSSSSCGFEFTEGESYLVYAGSEGNTDKLQTGLCSRTMLLSSAGEDLNELGPGMSPGSRAAPPGMPEEVGSGTIPEKPAESPEKSGSSISLYIYAGGSLVLLAAAVAAVLCRKPKSGRRK